METHQSIYYHQYESKETNGNRFERPIIKIGSSTITTGEKGSEMLDVDFMESMAYQVSTLYNAGIRPYIVSSGAVACGRPFIPDFDGSLESKQEAAALGQVKLMSEWDRQFAKFGINVYQLLLTEYSLPKAKILSRMRHGIPIVNANDPVNDYEMKQLLDSADNDKLAGIVAQSIQADMVFLLTDVEAVRNIHGSNISTIYSTIQYEDIITFNGKSCVGTGGMESKHSVALNLARNNIPAVICNGRRPNLLLDIANGKSVGTYYAPVKDCQYTS